MFITPRKDGQLEMVEVKQNQTNIMQDRGQVNEMLKIYKFHS